MLSSAVPPNATPSRTLSSTRLPTFHRTDQFLTVAFGFSAFDLDLIGPHESAIGSAAMTSEPRYECLGPWGRSPFAARIRASVFGYRAFQRPGSRPARRGGRLRRSRSSLRGRSPARPGDHRHGPASARLRRPWCTRGPPGSAAHERGRGVVPGGMSSATCRCIGGSSAVASEAADIGDAGQVGDRVGLRRLGTHEFDDPLDRAGRCQNRPRPVQCLPVRVIHGQQQPSDQILAEPKPSIG